VTKGRAVPELEEFEFPSTGKVVRVRPVSPMLSQEALKGWRKKNPVPEPPVIEVEVLGVKRREQNFDSPSWRMEMDQYEQRMREEVGVLSLKLMIMRGVVCDVDEEEIAQFRKDMASLDIEADGDDKYVYVTMLCAGTQQELNDLRDRIMVRSQPTPKEVEANITEFPGKVQG